MANVSFHPDNAECMTPLILVHYYSPVQKPFEGGPDGM